MKKIIILGMFVLFSALACDAEQDAHLDVRISAQLPSGDGYLVTQLWLESKDGEEKTKNLLPAGTALASAEIMEDLGPVPSGEYYYFVYFQGFQEFVSRETIELFPGRNNLEIPPPSLMDAP